MCYELKTLREERDGVEGVPVMEQDPIGPLGDRLLPPTTSTICLLLVEKASKAFPKFQRINLIREVRKCRDKGKQPSRTK